MYVHMYVCITYIVCIYYIDTKYLTTTTTDTGVYAHIYTLLQYVFLNRSVSQSGQSFWLVVIYSFLLIP